MLDTTQLSDREFIIKRYRIRSAGRNRRTIETSIPRLIFEREIRRLGLTVEEALKKVDAVWRFNDQRGLHLSFEVREPTLQEKSLTEKPILEMA